MKIGGLFDKAAQKDTVFTPGQTIWNGDDQWEVLEVKNSPVGGRPIYKIKGPLGEMKWKREDALIKDFSLEKNKPYAHLNQHDMPQWEHHKNIVPDEQARDKECAECKTMNEQNAKTCFRCNAPFAKGTGSARPLTDRNPEREQYIKNMTDRVQSEPWLKDHMPSDVQRRLSPSPRTPPGKLVDLLRQQEPGSKGPTDLPGVQHKPLNPKDPPPAKQPVNRPRVAPPDSGAVVVPDTMFMSDDDTKPTAPSTPTGPLLYNKPRIHQQIKHRPPVKDKPRAQPDAGILQWNMPREDVPDPDRPGKMKPMPGNVLVAPGVGRGLYMVRPGVGHEEPKKFGLYYKVRGESPLEEMGVFDSAQEAMNIAQRHFKQQTKQQSAETDSALTQKDVNRDHNDASDEDWRRNLEDERNKKGSINALDWDEITPGEEWLAPSKTGLRYVINLEDGQFILSETHRRWSSLGPVLGHCASLEEAMDLAERDYADQHKAAGLITLQSLDATASSVTPEMVLNEVKLMREAEIPEIDIRTMVEQYYPEVAAQVLKSAPPAEVA